MSPAQRLDVPGAAEQGVDVCHQHPQLEGLGQVIVPAQLQPHDDVHFFIGRCQEQDGHPGSPAHRAAEIEAGAVRQGDVQHQQVAGILAPEGIRFGQRPGCGHGKALLAERKGQPCDQTCIILQQ